MELKKFDKEAVKKRIINYQNGNDKETRQIIDRIVDEVNEDIEAKKRRAKIRYLILLIILSAIAYFSILFNYI